MIFTRFQENKQLFVKNENQKYQRHKETQHHDQELAERVEPNPEGLQLLEYEAQATTQPLLKMHQHVNERLENMS